MTRIGTLEIEGGVPHVAGVICRPDSVFDMAESDFQNFDIAEARLDEFGEDETGWTGVFDNLKSHQIPILATLRHEREGGRWTDDAGRAAILTRHLDRVDAVDLELESEAIGAMAPLLRERGKTLMASYHDFEKTPALGALAARAARAKALGADIFKIAALVRGAADHFTLMDFLRAGAHEMPLCVIAMGELGVAARVFYPVLGSCLTYGFVDKSSAPGQMSAARLTRALCETLPAYREDRERRMGIK